MALQDILKKILLDAEEAAKAIDSELVQAKELLTTKSKKLEEAELLKLKEKTQKVLDSIESKTRSMARREKSKIILETKQQIIKDFLIKLQERLEKVPDEIYGKIIKKLLEKITDKQGIIFTSNSRLTITKSLIPSGFKVEVDDNIKGGFIFKSKTGGEINNSFESLIHSEFRSNLEMYFSEQLKFI
jgi:vacuolar-type H+-ATPase subunit E/Vma4